MNGRITKKIRKEAKKRDEWIFPELKRFLNKQPFKIRVKMAWNLLRGRF